MEKSAQLTPFPFQACIKPVEVKKNPDAKDSTVRTDGRNYYEVSVDGTETQLEAATISLNDCLACSGCITSAESILVASQSHHDVYAVLASNISGSPEERKTIVITLSPQSRASFAAKYNLSPLSVHRKLYGFFKTLGCDHVVDASFARDFALIESAREFVHRFKSVNGVPGQGVLPMLASACPGWICYAEKTHDYILPNISTTKSPQQIMGTLLKTHFAEKMGLSSPASVYHVSVMPCYDKKLEASRADFYNDVYRTRDVDTVITTGEVERMLKEKGVSLHDLPEFPIPDLFSRVSGTDVTQELSGSEGSSSGGYLSYIFRYAVRELYGIQLSPAHVELGATSQDPHINADGSISEFPAWSVVIRPGRNLDFSEVVFRVGSVETLNFAKAYGFRNIQNLVRKAKPAGSSVGPGRAIRSTRIRASKNDGVTHHFVEVMACPSGCINGGGQLKPDSFDAQGNEIDSGPASKEYVQSAENIYLSVGQRVYLEPDMNASVVHLYQHWLGGLDSAESKRLLHTQYHEIAKLTEVNGLNVKW
ncbi:iron hydrogenase [Obelidium mucronatum]|nr:iron hydrogenase [Obelidium mucronatum]